MKKYKVLIPIIFIVIAMIAVHISKTLNDEMYSLPKGEYLGESTSENGEYTVRTYLCNGGATVDWAVRGELIINSKFNEKRNIYWQYKTSNALIKWKDNKTVIINGIEIDLPNGKYDYRVDSN